MALKMSNIVSNYKKLTENGNHYYENEIFTKFEDAFIYEAGAGKTGLKIVHNKRSIVTWRGKACELADVRCLFYSPKRKKVRLLFLQFKKEKYNLGLPFVVKINPNQFELYLEHPEVLSKVSTIAVPRDILKDWVYSCPHSGTMFALVKESITGDYPITFINADLLTWLGGDKYECPNGGHAIIERVPGFEYCKYIPNFQEFLKQAKDMHVGREIPLHHLSAVLGELMMEAPKDLSNLVVESKKEIGVEALDEVEDVSRYLNTIFLNVDELE